jgi:hypothetical protein
LYLDARSGAKTFCFYSDEATASSTPSPRSNPKALNLILKQSTSVLIAHRLSTVHLQTDYRIDGRHLERQSRTAAQERRLLCRPYNTYFATKLEYVEKAGQIYHSKQKRFPPPRRAAA